MSRRFSKPCSGCKSRRIACYPGSEVKPCQRCEARGTPCDVFEGGVAFEPRDTNDVAEMRAQMRRLDDLLHTLAPLPPLSHSTSSSSASTSTSDPGTPASTMASTVASTSESSGAAVEPVEINDLIGAMTNLCFSTEGLTGPIASRDDFGLMYEAGIALAQPLHNSLATEGFVFRAPDEPETLAELLAELPAWPEASAMLDAYARAWYSMNDALFTPQWFARVERLWAADFAGLRSPHQLAELFGVLAIHHSGEAVQRGSWTPEAKAANKRAEHYCICSRKALELGDYLEQPSLESVRALHLTATLHLLWATSTTHFSCAFAILPAAIAMGMALGLHQADVPGETPDASYERRALMAGLVRNDWTYPPSYGRPSSVTPAMVPLEPPDFLEDADVPVGMRDSPWRAARATVEGCKARYAFARLHRDMAVDLFASSRTCDYAAVRRYADRLRELEETAMPREWRLVEHADTGRLRWAVPTRDVDVATAVARHYAIPKLAKCGMALHRPFVGRQSRAAGDGVDEPWHRRELVRYARMSFAKAAEAQSMAGPFVSMSCSIFDTLIGLCLVIKQNADDPCITRYRDELSEILHAFIQPQMPAAIGKLLRLTTHLLDAPSSRRSADEADAGEPFKRARSSTLQIDAIAGGASKTPARPAPADASSPPPPPLAFDFAPPGTNLPSLRDALTFRPDGAAELPHKTPPGKSDFDRLAPFYTARNLPKLAQARSGLDVLSLAAAHEVPAGGG